MGCSLSARPSHIHTFNGFSMEIAAFCLRWFVIGLTFKEDFIKRLDRCRDPWSIKFDFDQAAAEAASKNDLFNK